MLAVMALLFLVIGALYASVGHAGASGYLAVMALLNVPMSLMRPTALLVNVCVASIACVQFARAGHFRWRLFWPFAIAAVPAAFVGGMLSLPARSMQLLIGVVLALACLRMAWETFGGRFANRPTRPPTRPVAIGTGGVLGFVAGLTGTGGGIFLSPLMLVCRWADTKRTAATSALFILVNSVAGLGGVSLRGGLSAPHLALLACCAGAGGVIGAWWGSRRAAPRSLYAALACVLLLASAKLLLG
ncbi:MAG: sulfite exporter TauE/SafE family protein [Planctomycetes bacterium]|nr:sulfite exporter TauE/SafE family protein [Planctomycetota bacterium]